MTLKDLTKLVMSVKADIDDDCRAFEGDEDPGIQLTVAYNGGDPRKAGDDWGWQTGDNSYTGGAYLYRHWAVVGVYRASNCGAVARDIMSQIEDLGL